MAAAGGAAGRQRLAAAFAEPDPDPASEYAAADGLRWPAAAPHALAISGQHDTAAAELAIACQDQAYPRQAGRHPIVLAPRDAATSWCAADGRVARLRTAPALDALIHALNAGQPVAVQDAQDLATSRVEYDLLSQVLAMLASWRVLAGDLGRK